MVYTSYTHISLLYGFFGYDKLISHHQMSNKHFCLLNRCGWSFNVFFFLDRHSFISHHMKRITKCTIKKRRNVIWYVEKENPIITLRLRIIAPVGLRWVRKWEIMIHQKCIWNVVLAEVHREISITDVFKFINEPKHPPKTTTKNENRKFKSCNLTVRPPPLPIITTCVIWLLHVR